MAALGSLAVAMGVLGLIILFLGFSPPIDSPSHPKTSRLVASIRIRMHWSRRRQLLTLGGVVLGTLLWLMTGWVVFLLGLPLAALLLPALFSTGGASERLDRLDALESWTRSLAGLTVAGAGLEQTIAASLSSTGDAIKSHVATLVARIHARWRTDDALRAFADDIADPTCDLVVMHLLLSERMRGPGLARALEDLAGSISDEVRARRAIETDRAKPRQNTRIITVTTLALLCAMPFTGAFMAPYSSAIGQLILAVWVVLYGLTLVWLKRIAEPQSVRRPLMRAEST